MNTVPLFSAPNTGAIRFSDIDNESVTVAHDAALSAANWTVEAWVTTTNTDGDFNRVVTKAVGGGQTYSIVVINGEAQIRSSVGVITSTGITVADGEPHHIAGVYDSVAETLALYVDGALISSISTTGQTLSQGTEDVFIGDYPAPFVEAFDGDISDVRIWSDARSTEEIAATFDQSLDGGAPNLELHLRFDGDATDSSGNGRDGVINGSPVFVEGLAPVDPLPFDPMTLAATEDVAEAITGLQVSDADPGAILTVTVEASSGALTLATTTGLTFTAGGNGSATFTAQGTVADLNAALATFSYLGNPDFNGVDNIVLTVDDGQADVVEPIAGATTVPNAGFYFLFDFDTGLGSSEPRVGGAPPTNVPTNGVYIQINPNNANWGANAVLVQNGVESFLDPNNFALAGYTGAQSISGEFIFYEEAIFGATLTFTNEDTPTPTGARDLTLTVTGIDFDDISGGILDLTSVDIAISSEAVQIIPVTVASVVDAAPVITQAQATGEVFEPEADALPGLAPLTLFDDFDGSDGFGVAGAVTETRLGNSVAGLGDVNGDGFDDFIIGSYRSDLPAGANAGSAHIIFGTGAPLPTDFDVSTLDGTNGFTFDGISANGLVGRSVDGIGDINSDGFDDILIGASTSEVFGLGEAFLIYGKASGFASTLVVGDLDGVVGTTLGGITYSSFGQAVSNAGDVNGDGIDDLIIGAQTRSLGGDSQVGASYVLFGQVGGFGASFNFSALDGTNGFAIEGVDAGDRTGIAVDGGGDINGDGFDDLLIGAYRADSGPYTDNGAVYVVFGDGAPVTPTLDLSTLDGTNGFLIEGNADAQILGQSISFVGDINDDGIDDFAIGNRNSSPNGLNVAGQVHVVFGDSSGAFPANLDIFSLDGTNGFIIEGAAIGERVGNSVSSAGDLNGDGVDDLLIGTIGNFGKTFVVYGTGAGFGATFNLGAIDGLNGIEFNGADGGVAVASIGDFNGDGVDDVVSADRNGNPNGSSSGQAFAAFGISENGLASGDIQFQNGTSRDSHTVATTLNTGPGLGVFTAEIVDAHDPGGLGVVEWNFLVTAAELDPLAAGETIIQTYDVTIANPDNSIVQTITVTINGANDTPIALDDNFTVSEDLILIGDLLADNGSGADFDPDASDMLTVTEINGIAVTDGEIVMLASGAELTINADGSFAFDGRVAFNGLDAGGGSDAFTYTIADSTGAISTATASITINAENDAPVISAPQQGGAARFDGNAANAVTVAHDPALSAASWTVEAWVTTNDADAEFNRILTKPVGGNQTYSLVVKDGEAHVRFGVPGDNSVQSVFIADGQPHHIAGVFDAATDTLSLFVDGVLAGQLVTPNTPPQGTEPLNIGRASPAFTQSFEGDISEVRVWSFARTAVEISNDFDKKLVAGEPGLELYLTFDDDVVDQSGNGRDGAITGVVPFVAGAAPVDATFTAVEDQPALLEGVVIDDPDAGAGILRLTVSVDNGLLNFTSLAGATQTSSPLTSPTITLEGDLAQLNAALQTLNYLGDLNFNGAENLTIVVDDLGNSGAGGALTDTQIVAFNVTPVNDAPLAIDDALATNEETPISGDLFADNGAGADFDPDFDPISVTEINGAVVTDGQMLILASGASLIIRTDGTFDYDPTAAFATLAEAELGGDSFTYTITDGEGATSTATANFVIAGLNDTPTAEDDDLTTDEDTVLLGDLLADNFFGPDFDIDNNALLSIIEINGTSVFDGEAVALPSGAILLIRADGTFDYDPNGAFEALPEGAAAPDSFTYTIADEFGATSIATANVTILGVNDAPQAFDERFDLDEETPISGDLFADANSDGFVDFDPEGDAFFVTQINGAAIFNGQTITLPGGGILTIRTDGTFDFDPVGAYDDVRLSDTRIESFTYRIEDTLGGTSIAQADLFIAGVNDAPIAADDEFSTDEDSGFSGDLFADNGFGPDFDVDDPPMFGVSKLCVTEINGVPVLGEETVALTSGALLTIREDGTFDYDPNGAFDALGAGDFTSETFTYTLADAEGATSQATVSVNINGVNDAPLAANDSFVIAGGTVFSGDLISDNGFGADFDVDAGAILSVTEINGVAIVGEEVITLPSGAVLTIRPNGTFDYDPAGAEGSDSFAYTISDGFGGISSANAQITIEPVNTAPLARNDLFSTDEDTAISGLFLFADNGSGVDVDDDGDGLSLVSIEGVDVSAGDVVLLASGAELTIGEAGEIAYDPNSAFEALTDGEIATDSFVYQISDGQGGTSDATIVVEVAGLSDILFGTDESDILEGTAGADDIRALNGDDFVSGFAGDDIIDGGAGADRARGGLGEDSINGGEGDDALFGDGGDDVLAGGVGNDRLRGQRGDDRLLGEDGDDILGGARGADTLLGGDGADTLAGGGDNDRLRGQAGDDKLGGSRGDDALFGGAGADRIRGGGGDDTLIGGAGDDTLIGGAGDDVFQFAANDGSDTIRRFQQNTDLIEITTDGIGFEDLSIAQQGANVLISFAAGDLLVVAQSNADFGVEDFIFSA